MHVHTSFLHSIIKWPALKHAINTVKSRNCHLFASRGYYTHLDHFGLFNWAQIGFLKFPGHALHAPSCARGSPCLGEFQLTCSPPSPHSFTTSPPLIPFAPNHFYHLYPHYINTDRCFPPSKPIQFIQTSLLPHPYPLPHFCLFWLFLTTFVAATIIPHYYTSYVKVFITPIGPGYPLPSLCPLSIPHPLIFAFLPLFVRFFWYIFTTYTLIIYIHHDYTLLWSAQPL